MEELPPPTWTPRRRARARQLPGPPRAFWVALGLAIVLWGFWSLRPRDEATPDNGRAGQPAANATAERAAAAPPTSRPGEPTSAPQPALQPIEPVLHAEPRVPPADVGTGSVGQPTLEATGDGQPLPESYTVVAGDTMGNIAARFGVAVADLMALNGLSDPNTLFVGQVLALPRRVTLQVPFQRLLPDSELVLSPAYKGWNLQNFIEERGGFLAGYREQVEGEELGGVEIVERVSQRYSVGSRPLLAMLEFQSGWVTQAEPTERVYPMGLQDPPRAGLFFQLSWAANRMNQGFYGTATGRDRELRFKDGTRALLHPETNPATAAIQNAFAVNGTPDSWSAALADTGFYATYLELFGDPWRREVAPLLPPDLEQPELQLPWASGETWYLTGGPHGGWGDLSGWAALDIVPADNTGCAPSGFVVRAAAPGRVIRSENGEVVVDLDGDGFVGTGWTVLYMHMASGGRVAVGTTVEVGDPLGYPSCEGGFSDAAHLHIARRFNGQWIEADGDVPFVLDGWQAEVAARTYEGFLVRGDERREACVCRSETVNGITAP